MRIDRQNIIIGNGDNYLTSNELDENGYTDVTIKLPQELGRISKVFLQLGEFIRSDEFNGILFNLDESQAIYHSVSRAEQKAGFITLKVSTLNIKGDIGVSVAFMDVDERITANTVNYVSNYSKGSLDPVGVIIGNGDKFITPNEIDTDKNVEITIKLPDSARVGDTVTITDGTVTLEHVLIDNDISNKQFIVKLPAPNEGERIEVTAKISDPTGRESDPTTSYADRDTLPPELNITIDPVSGDDVINATESKQNIPVTGKVTGEYNVGDTVTLTVGGQSYTGKVTAGGNYTISVPGAVLAQNSNITAKVTTVDAAGNPNSATADRAYTVDTAAPQLGININVIAGDDVINATESKQNIPVTGKVTGEYNVGDTVTLTVGGQSYTGKVTAGGNYTISVPGAVLAQNSNVTAKITTVDAAGNPNSATADRAYTVDTAAPTIQVLNNDSVVEASRNTINSSIKVTDSNSISRIDINNKNVIGASQNNPVVIQTDKGILKILGYDRASGIVNYTYTEAGKSHNHSSGDNSISDVFTIRAIDAAGNTSVKNWSVSIIDTAPTAQNDEANIIENMDYISGNLLNNDRLGADAVTVNEANIQGKYGQLIINSDGSYKYTLNNTNPLVDNLETSQRLTDRFSYTIKDIDGDVSSAALSVNINGISDAPQLVIGNNATNNLSGKAGNDVLIGDMGGTNTIVTPGQNYNVTILLDTSNSMNVYGINTVWGRKSYADIAKESLKKLVTDLAYHDGQVKLTLVAFNTSVKIEFGGSYFSKQDLAAALQKIEQLQFSGNTNYELGFTSAQNSIKSTSQSGFENVTYFITDGEPTTRTTRSWLDWGAESFISQDDANYSLQAFKGLNSISAVHAIGFSSVSKSVLDHFDNTSDLALYQRTDSVRYQTSRYGTSNINFSSEVGDSAIVRNGDELDTALKQGKVVTTLNKISGDVITGAEGNDIIFGDTINTDHLSWVDNNTGIRYDSGSHDGMGVKGLQEYLKWTHGNGNAVSDKQIIDYVQNNWHSLLDARNDGGNDIINGGSGNDILIGGAGNDILTGGDGSDLFVFITNSNSGHNVIKDFKVGEDKLVLTEKVDLSTSSWDNQAKVLKWQYDGKDNSITLEGIKYSYNTLNDFMSANINILNTQTGEII